MVFVAAPFQAPSCKDGWLNVMRLFGPMIRDLAAALNRNLLDNIHCLMVSRYLCLAT